MSPPDARSCDVSIVVPTMRRPQSLERALKSLFAQAGVGNRVCDIVVVDNDPQGSARETVQRLNSSSPWPLLYRSAPKPGVATARNAGVAATAAPLIAFLDDDEAASPGWLRALLDAMTTTGADVVFGPIRGQAPDAEPRARPYLERFFGREGPDRDQTISSPFGCGNSLMHRATALPGTAPFDVSADQIGGEDDLLFAALSARGGTYGWAAKAWVDEFAPPHRATLAYALKRAFAYGQGPSQAAIARRDWAGVLRWMIVGAIQAVVWGSASAGLLIVQSARRAEAMDRTARGLGKLFWMRGFEPRLYGDALIAPGRPSD